MFSGHLVQPSSLSITFFLYSYILYYLIYERIRWGARDIPKYSSTQNPAHLQEIDAKWIACISHRLYELLLRTDSTDRESLGINLLLVNPETKMDTCFVEGCGPEKFLHFPFSSACSDASHCPRKSGWRRSRAFLKSILLLLLSQEFSFHLLVGYSGQQEPQKGPVLNKRESRNILKGGFLASTFQYTFQVEKENTYHPGSKG